MVLDLTLDPIKGSETGKIRPCIVVTNNVYNARVPVIQVVPITAWSDKKTRIRTNVTLEPKKPNGFSRKSIALSQVIHLTILRIPRYISGMS